MRKLVLIPFLLVCLVCTAQRSVMPTQLKLYLLEHKDSNEDMQLYVKGDVHRITEFVLGNGGMIRHQIAGYVAISIATDKVEDLVSQSFISEVPFRISTPQTMNDSMIYHHNIQPVHDGVGPLDQAYTGKGVIVGIIDTGLDWSHGDFNDSLGNTKILALWDQKYPVAGNTPMPYGYGQEWDSAAINALACPHEDSAFIYYGHGTSVAGTAAGTGLETGNFKGVAIESDIIAVASDFYASDWYGSIADAVDYIFRKADTLGKPCVINLSLGTYAGSHDGKDPASLFIDSLLTMQDGRAMCAAAGNAGHLPFHVGYDITSDTSFTWMEYAGNVLFSGVGGFYTEVWSDTADLNNAFWSIAADSMDATPVRHDMTSFYDVSTNLGMTITDTLYNGTDTIGFVDFTLTLLGDRYRLEMFVYGTSSILQEYAMGIQFTGSGHVDMWGPSWEGYSWLTSSGLPTVGAFPPIAYYVTPDQDQTMVDMIQCSDQILTVANYQNRESYIDLNSTSQPVTGSGTGTIVNTSSHGPTRDDRTKPSIGSPGLFCMVPATVEFIQWQWANEPFKVAEDSMHTRGAGTSVASPSIAGICALYLEKCPNASNVEVMNAVTGTAIQDANTGAVPNNTWGWGKADAFAALISSNFSLSLTTDALCCGGDSVLITAPAGYAIYDWNNGDTTQSIYVDVDGSYWATVTDSSGCVGSTDTASIVITSIPDPESIQASVYPNPATDELTFTVSEHGMYRIILASAVGSILSPTYSQWMVLNANEPMTIDIGHLAPGVYFFELFDQVNGSYHETIVVQ